MLSTTICENSLPAALAEAAEWERAARLLGLESAILQRIRRPAFEGQVQLPLDFAGEHASLLFAADSFGSREKLLWLRLVSHIDAAELTADLRELRLQLALVGAPTHAAVVAVVAPSGAGERELWQLAITASPVVSHLFGSFQMHATEKGSAVFADWMAEAPGSSIRSAHTQAAVLRQDKLMAKLAFEACRRALKDVRQDIARCRFSAVGASGATVPLLQEMLERGARLAGVADESGGLLCDGEIEFHRLLKHVTDENLVVEYKGGEHVLRTQVTQRDVDLLILDSSQQDVTAATAERIQAKMILDLSDQGVTPDAARILAANGTSVVPGRLLRAFTLLHPQVDPNGIEFRRVWYGMVEKAHYFRLDLPDALLVLALDRLAEAERGARPW